MGLTSRWAAAREARAARTRGLEAGAGIEVATVPDDQIAGIGRVCPSCGAMGSIELVDTVRVTASLSCPGCGEAWSTGDLDTIDWR